MAGHDVLAISLRAIFYYLARHPRVLSKLRAEINATSHDYPWTQPIPYSRSLLLPYL